MHGFAFDGDCSTAVIPAVMLGFMYGIGRLEVGGWGDCYKWQFVLSLCVTGILTILYGVCVCLFFRVEPGIFTRCLLCFAPLPLVAE